MNQSKLHMNIPFNYWFEASVLTWNSQHLPCLTMVSCEKSNPEETFTTDFYIHNTAIFDNEDEAIDYAKKDCSDINPQLGIDKESLIGCTRLSEQFSYFPRLLFVDQELTPKSITKDRAMFIRFLSQKSIGE